MKLRITLCPTEAGSLAHLVYYCPSDFPEREECYLRIRNRIFRGEANKLISKGEIAMNKVQRVDNKCHLNTYVDVIEYDVTTVKKLVECCFMIRYKNERGFLPFIDIDFFDKPIQELLCGHIVSISQTFGLFHRDKLVLAQVANLTIPDNGMVFGMITKDTKIRVVIDPESKMLSTRLDMSSHEKEEEEEVVLCEKCSKEMNRRLLFIQEKLLKMMKDNEIYLEKIRKKIPI